MTAAAGLAIRMLAMVESKLTPDAVQQLTKFSRPLAARMFLSIAIVVAVGRVFGVVFRRLNLPGVLGEILAGICLGPSLLGLISKDLPAKIFPLEIRPLMRIVAELGLIVFMFIVGLEIDPKTIRRSGRRAVVISVSSVAVPFFLGVFVLAPYLYHDHKLVPVEGAAPVVAKRLAFSLFIGISMCVTAFPILARILAERRMFRIPLGMLLISAAAADDIMAFALLTLTLSIAGTGEGHLPLIQVVVLLAGFIALLFLVVRPVLERVIVVPYRRDRVLRPDMLALLLGSVAACAYFSFRVMDTSLIGPFLLGAAMPRKDVGHLFENIAERVEGISVTLLLPVFFVVTGLGVNISGLGRKGIVPALLILAVACLGKFVGAGVAAKLQGVSTRQSLAIGLMMNTRGLAELVILGIAREAHILDGQLYTMLVIMTVVTTLMAGPLLRLVYPDKWLEREIADAERVRAGTAVGVRVLVAVHSPATASRLLDVALGAAGTASPGAPKPSILLTHLTTMGPAPTELGAGMSSGLAGLSDSIGAMAELRTRIEAAGATCTITSRLSSSPAADLGAQATAIKPDVVVVGWEPGDATSREVAEHLASLAPGLTVIVAGPAPDAAASPLVAVGSGRDNAAAVELSARLARGRSTEVLIAAKEGGRGVARLRRDLAEVGVRTSDIDTVGHDDVAGQARRASMSTVSVVALELVDGHFSAADASLADTALAPILFVRGVDRDPIPLADALGVAPTPQMPLLFGADSPSDPPA